MVEPGARSGRAPRVASAGVFFLVALLILTAGAWTRDLFDADEGRYGSVAVAMLENGDGITPRLNGMPFMDKPPLVYWVQLPFLGAFGRHALAARAPTLLAGALWALWIHLFALGWAGSRRIAWWAGLLAVTSAGGVLGSRVGPQMDMPLAAAIAGALYAGWRHVVQPGRAAAMGLGLALGLGLLVKGPLAVAVPALVALAWGLGGVAPRRLLATALSPWAWGVTLLVAAPWYVLMERANPGWIEHFIRYEHFGRFSRADHRAFHPFWFYVPIALIYMAPWTAMAWGGRRGRGTVRALLGCLTCSPWSPRPWGEALPVGHDVGRARPVAAGRLAWTWFLVAFLLYSVASRKLLNYLLPAAAPLFILLGARFEACCGGSGWRARWLPTVLGAATVALGALIHAGLFFPFATGHLPATMEAPRFSPAGAWWMAAGALVLLVCVPGWRFLRSARLRGAVLVCAGALGWLVLDQGLAQIDAVGSARRIGAALRRQAPGADALLCFKRYPQGLGFYGGPRLWIAGGTPAQWEQREIVNPYARRLWEAQPRRPDGLPDLAARDAGFLTTDEFERLWGSPARLVLVCRWAEIAPLRATLLEGPFGGAGRTDLFIVSNHAVER